MALRQITEPKTSSAKKILIFGNSLALHSPAPDIGWTGDWGMAASRPENDFAHVLAALLAKEYGDIDCAVSQGAEWERHISDEGYLAANYADAAAFSPDIAFIRIGENVPAEEMEKRPLKDAFIQLINFLTPRPGSRAVVSDMFWKHPAKDTPAREAADETGSAFAVISDLGLFDENKAIGQFEHQGVASHPSDAGMRRIAERLFNAAMDLKKLPF